MTITNSSTRLFALATGVAVAIALMGAVAIAPAQAQSALTPAQIQAIVSLLSSFGADQATINNVTAALNGQPTSGNPSTPSTGGACPALSRDLQQGSTGADVMALQVYLNGSASTQVAVTGAGSPGNETQTFGPATKAAVIKFQSANGVSPAAGYVGPLTRAKIASLCGSGNPTTPPTTGGSVVVGAAAQPVNSLAPSGANRVPFTTFTITNNSAAQVTINSVTVQRTGLGVDANFSGIVLVDQNGLQIGTAKTLNSNHQANLDGFTLNVGETKTLTVVGNISSTGAQSGQIVSLQVVAVNTGATVGGALPITGASQTINTTLTLGSVSTSTSSFDPGANQTKTIGDTGIRFSGIRFTAGSAEDIKLYSIRWRQVGTASASDISNIMTNVNGTDYPTTVSSDGKYYTTTIPGGLLIAKGNSVDVYVKGDVIGSNASSRTVAFDIDRSTDVYFIGQTYGYGVSVTGTYTPWFDSFTTTIQGGTATTISKANEVAAQNVAINVNNQPLGAFATDFKGEAVSITGMTVTLATSTAATGLLTSVSIVDQNGTAVAGPVDATWSSGSMVVVFTDTITFPIGRQVYTLKGKIPSTATGGAVVTAQITPSGWTNPTGQTSGNSVSLSGFGTISLNSMTVKGASLTIGLSSSPASQNIVAGAQGVTFANIQLDATQSGEDVRLSSIPLVLTVGTAAVGELTSCQLWDGSVAINTGSNVPTITAASGSDTTFTFDNSITITKGTVKTLTLKCNVASTVSNNDTFAWSVDSSDTFNATGVTSGNSITESVTTQSSGTMTVNSGSLAVTVDSSSPSYTVAAGGQTGVTLGVVKLRASNEAVNLTKLGLTFTSGSPTSTNVIYLYAGNNVKDTAGNSIAAGTLIGTASFTGGSVVATSSLSTAVQLPKDVDATITVKADLLDIGSSAAGVEGALVKLDPLNAEGNGSGSGTTIAANATAGVAGVRVYNTYPTVALDTLGSTGIADGRLLRFKVTAASQDQVGLGRFTFKVATTTLTVSNVQLFGYTDASYSSPVSGQGTSGQIGNTATPTSTDAFIIAPNASPVEVPAGQTYYFELKGAIAGNTTGASVVTTLLGDTSASPSSGTSQFASVAGNFVWSPNATGTAATTSGNDWTNGFGVAGLPSGGLFQARGN